MYIVHNAGTECVDGTAQEVQTDGHIFLGSAERKRLEQYDGNADYTEKCSHRGVSEVVSRVEAINHHFEDVPRCVNDFVDVVSIVGVPFRQGAEGYGVTIAVGRAGSFHAVGLSMCLHGCVVSASLHDRLESKRVEIYARIFKLYDQDLTKLWWN